MNKVKRFVKRETVLSAAVILAILSAMVIRPDREYGSYIDYKTIGLLFCLMTVMAGLQSLGVFKKAGERLLGYVKGPGAVSAVLVFLCFFFSMAITNDVALITFVPFAVAVLKMAGMEKRRMAGDRGLWSAGFPDFHRKQRVWRRQERGFT